MGGLHIDIWGRRTGKTTSRAIPAILAAPGAALVTSNKCDIVDGTRDVRAALLAAALDGRPITQVHTWLTRPTEDEAVDILKTHGFARTSNAVGGVVNAPEKQRGGVYGTALQMASCLTNRQVARWVTPQGEKDERPQFDPAAFVRSKGTLYSLSKEGKGTAGPLVTALTVATVEAAEERAVHSPGGRLATPMIGVLDEAANVCRWRELPNLYSHYGSRGIVLMTILQSWSQGVEVWGREGMRKLWSAANIKVYGGGAGEAEFLNELAQLVGEYRYSNMTKSRSKQGTSYSHDDDRKERTLDVSDLAAFPRGRAIMFASGAPAALLETVPWMSGPHAEAVRASIAAHDPTNHPAASAGNRQIAAGAPDE